MKHSEMDILENKLTRLCNHYKIPEEKRPLLEFFQQADDCVGWYNDVWNEIYIFKSLSLLDATKILRHEFGHFLLEMRHPKHKVTKGEERTCRMMERTLLRFNYLADSKQKSLDSWIEEKQQT